MAIFYVDPINGLDSNNGTTWALARKNMTATGWQSFPGLAGSDSIYVAKSPDPVDIGSVTLTTGSKNAVFNDPYVAVLFDANGSRDLGSPNAYRNGSLTTPVIGDFQLNGSLGTFSLGVRARAKVAGSYQNVAGTPATPAKVWSYVGALSTAPLGYGGPFYFTSKQYIAVKVSGRSTTASLAISLNNPSMNGGAAAGFGGGTSNEDVVLVAATPDGYGNQIQTLHNRALIVGGALYSNESASSLRNTERMGGVDTIFFEVGSALGDDVSLSNIGFYTNDSSGTTSTMTIDAIYWVTDVVLPNQNLGTIINSTNNNGHTTNEGLNALVGFKDSTMMQLSSLGIQPSVVTSGVRSIPKFMATMTFNWGLATATKPGRMALSYQIGYDTFLSAGGGTTFSVVGGVNKDTNVVDGVTRLSGKFSTTTSVAPGPNIFELYLRSGVFSGFSTHNFAQGLRLKLNSSRINENYTFEDIQGNNFGYYIYSDDGTCPSKVFLHYKSFGPNNALLVDSTMTACGGWSANLTKAYANTSTANVGFSLTIQGAPPVMLEWGVNIGSASSFSPMFIKPYRWSSASTSSFTQTSFRRNRGMKYVSASTSNVSESLRRGTKRSFVVTNVSSSSMMFGKRISPIYNVVGYTGVSNSMDVGKGFAWNVPTTTAAVFTLPTNIPVTWSIAAVTEESFTTARTRGYKWSSPMTVTYTEGVRVARTANYTSTTNVAVNELLSKKVVRGFNSNTTSTVTETVPVARGISTLIQTVSSGAVNLLRALKIGKFTSSNTTNVSETLMRARTVTMPVVATSTITTLTRRGKAVAFALSAASSVSNKLRRSIPGQWVSSNNVQIYFDQNKMFRWTVAIGSTVVNSIRRNRGVKFTAQEAMTSSWNVGAKRGTSMANVSATTSSNMSLDRVRGMFFTVPVYGHITQDIDLKSRTNSVITAHPVISISLTRSNNRGFEVLGQTGSEMTVRLNKGMYYTVGQYVTIDGELLKDTFVEQDGFGAISSSDFAFGIGRGVRHETVSELDVSMDMVRDIIIGWSVVTNSNMGVSSNPNRLDAFYVDYEEPVTSSLKDGSIVMGQRKTYSSGILHDVRPVFDVTIHPAPTYTITLYEEVFA